MKTDTLFYRLFQAFPSVFFELIGQAGSVANSYQFTSIELKQQAFRLDGVFLPTPNNPNQLIYFLEVQFQKDEAFYQRVFAEIFLYLYQYQSINDWRAVVIFPRRSLEPDEPKPYRLLLNSPQVQRVYLNELGESADTSIGVGIVQLVVESESRTPAKAKQLIEQARQQLTNALTQQEIIEFIETVSQRGLGGFPHERLAHPKGSDLQISPVKPGRGRSYVRFGCYQKYKSLSRSERRRQVRSGSPVVEVGIEYRTNRRGFRIRN